MAKIEHQPLNDRAYDEILKGLSAGIFAPMQPLVIRTLAETYGISATPIREACSALWPNACWSCCRTGRSWCRR